MRTTTNEKKIVVQPKFGKNFIQRTIYGLMMLALYIFISYRDKIFLVTISLILSVGFCYEIVSITKKSTKPYPLNKCLMFLIAIIIGLQKTVPSFAVLFPNAKIFTIIVHQKPLFFTLYAISLMIAVGKLKKHMVSSQLLLLVVIHSAAYVSSMVCSFSIMNIKYGKFFYVYPSLLVIANDISAYLIGRAIGRTPLFVLSPKKTVEGFVGGFLCTFLVGLLLSYLKVNGFFLPDSSHSDLNMPITPNLTLLNFPSMYLHNIAFSFFASFVAPFCGFLASAIKRAFQKKDFGTIIPGHGGITDRFDCQVLMVFFTFYYLKLITQTNRSAANTIYQFLIENFKEEEIEELYNIISAKVN